MEGFHQKIRQLVRGFIILSRYALALLFLFVHRWNHDIDVRILGLLTKYLNFYDGWEIEQEIEVCSTWEELLDKLHSEYASTRHYKSIDEVFGLTKKLH